MKKVISVVGARPNFMKIAPVHRAFGKYADTVEHKIVHTGQHYDFRMSSAFFRDLQMPEPAVFMNVGSGSHAVQTAKVMVEFEKVCLNEKPDLVLVAGDVNSTVAAALTAVKLDIPVAHIEGGLRSGDRKMPEEINRIATDAICDYCFTTEPDAEENLRRENFPAEHIFEVGNTMIDSQKFAIPAADKCDILARLGLQTGKYVPITIHRPSNVDEPEQLEMLLKVLSRLSNDRKIVFPIHPRTMKNIEKFGFEHYTNDNGNIIFTEPMGYIEFLAVLKNADFVMTDSGGIQEETTALGVSCLTLRTSTERPITITMGTNELISPEYEKITSAVNRMLSGERKAGTVPPLWDGRAAERICSY